MSIPESERIKYEGNPLEQVEWYASILAEIERSKSILTLEDDWDGEGSSGYELATWQRTTNYLKQNALRLWDSLHIALDTPNLSAGPDGSFDIDWKTDKRDLLINIPEDQTKLADFYGSNKAGQIVKGDLDISNPNQWLLIWLMQ